jgi:hypothetical protein
MAHPLKGKLSVDVDNDHVLGWPGGLDKLARVRVDGTPIGAAFFDPHMRREGGDRVVTPATLDEALHHGILPCLRYDTSWDGGPGTPPEVCAQRGSEHIAWFERDGKRRVVAVEWDNESHDALWEMRFLLGYVTDDGRRVKGIRGCGGSFPDPARPETLGYRWGRPFVWTFEGRQTVAQSAANHAAKAGGLVGPQLYNGPMTETWSMWREIRYWVGVGVPIEQLLFYVDARRRNRDSGVDEAVLFATSRLTELYED